MTEHYKWLVKAWVHIDDLESEMNSLSGREFEIYAILPLSADLSDAAHKNKFAVVARKKKPSTTEKISGEIAGKRHAKAVEKAWEIRNKKLKGGADE